jgi:hypothetical protein
MDEVVSSMPHHVLVETFIVDERVLPGLLPRMKGMNQLLSYATWM